MRNPITDIFYQHDDENILKGYAMIIGQKDTPYAYGYYLFEFTFPENYPYEPPILTFLTNDGHMRFNPNLYINGKVCLSVLNTWAGEGWTSCQNISSILLILSSILNNNPLKNEPGISDSNPNVYRYNCLVAYKNLEFAIFEQLKIVRQMYKEKSDICQLKDVSLNAIDQSQGQGQGQGQGKDYKTIL